VAGFIGVVAMTTGVQCSGAWMILYERNWQTSYGMEYSRYCMSFAQDTGARFKTLDSGGLIQALMDQESLVLRYQISGKRLPKLAWSIFLIAPSLWSLCACVKPRPWLGYAMRSLAKRSEHHRIRLLDAIELYGVRHTPDF